jgi:prefoldin subunit 5
MAIDLEESQRDLAAANATREQLEAQLNASQAELAETRTALAHYSETLETIRNSKLFRWTRGLRRIYYRLR